MTDSKRARRRCTADARASCLPACVVAALPRAAILFHSIKPTGELERKSLHTACPVIKGTKWSAAKWIHVSARQLLCVRACVCVRVCACVHVRVSQLSTG